MKVIKPNKLGVLTRCVEHERRFVFGVSVLVFVPLGPVEALTLGTEQALWMFAAERMGPLAALEAGVPKSRGEFLVHGECFAPGGVPHPRVPVRARVGECERTLMVTGDRYWKPGGSPSDPRPFVRMPLAWERAYGGPKYGRNPLGRGHGKSAYMGQTVQLLPNIEDPRAPVLAPGDRPEPVGFGPLDISWPQRLERAGTYDAKWLEQQYPGLARDVDWQMFNLAQPAQHVDGFWEGGEPYRFENMHPERPVLEGELPRLRARAFVGRHTGGDPEAPVELQPVEMTLRTVWAFPDAEQAVLVYQGSTPVTEDDGRDVEYLMLAAEHPDRPRTPEHYAAVLEARLDTDRAAQAVLREHELLPEDVADAVDERAAREQSLYRCDRRLEHNLHRRAVREYERAVADLRQRGLDPDDFGLEPPAPPPPTLSPDQVPGVVEEMQVLAKEKQEQEQEAIVQIQAQMRAKLEDMGFNAEERARMVEPAGLTGPPSFTAQGKRREAEALVEHIRQSGSPTEQLERLLFDPTQLERWRWAEAQLRDTYRQSAHLQDPAPPLPPAASQAARERVQRAVPQAESFVGVDLTGADLSGMELRGADLHDAWLESTILDGGDLRGASLPRAVLAHASLRKVRLDGADLSAANLGHAVLHDACLAEANLQGAQLTEADLGRASLRGARLHEATLHRTVLTDADLSEIESEQLTLVEVQATGVRLSGARLPRAVFVKLDLRGADLSSALLTGATFVGCNLSEVNLAQADLSGARFVDGCQLTGAVLVGAKLAMTNLRGSAMRGCDLSQALLDGADLSECDLAEAKLYRAVARGTRFERADLHDASLVAANLMHASFIHAVIRGADLRGSNLFAADMARVRTDERVQLEGANLTRVRIHPRHEEEVAT